MNYFQLLSITLVVDGYSHFEYVYIYYIQYLLSISIVIHTSDAIAYHIK